MKALPEAPPGMSVHEISTARTVRNSCASSRRPPSPRWRKLNHALVVTALQDVAVPRLDLLPDSPPVRM